MHRTLERLDAAASTLVPLLYLAGLALGTIAYFTGVTMDAGLSVGVALALAAEVHSFLEQRRCRAVNGALTRLADDDPRREGMRGQLRLHLGILAALVAFSTYNSIQFVASYWHPTSGFLPTSVQIAIRGAIVPALFLLTGALSPLTEDAGALLARASSDMLHKTLRATLKQWRRRVDRAARRGDNLAPVTVALMVDAGDKDGARRIRLIDDGLARAETPRPPTGGGSPTLLPVRTVRTRARDATASAEARVMELLDSEPRLSVTEIVDRLGVSRSTASKYKTAHGRRAGRAV